jgi:hypothetical protein
MWKEMIERAEWVRKSDHGPAYLIAVGGTDSDAAAWSRRLARTASAVHNEHTKLAVVGVSEPEPLGTFFGTLRAHREALRQGIGELPRDRIGLLSMLVGKGKRLSPFTQALGNRKAAFPVPRRLPTGGYMMVAELANHHINPLVEWLEGRGFRGILVKWGDEIIVPEHIRAMPEAVFAETDVVRFVSRTTPTPVLARQKEWLVYERADGALKKELPRQEYAALRESLGSSELAGCEVGVNLGTFAISNALLSALSVFFERQVENGDRVVDWDPLFWFAFLCRNEGELSADLRKLDPASVVARVSRSDPSALVSFLDSRRAAEEALGRPVHVRVVDLGEVYWGDLGLHDRLREHFEALTRRDDVGSATRALYGLGEAFDSAGNLVVRSVIPRNAAIRDSVIVDARIEGSASRLRGAVVIGGDYGSVKAEQGGVIIQSRLSRVEFSGKRGVVFRCAGNAVSVGDFERLTTVPLEGGLLLKGSEVLTDLDGLSYSQPVLGNHLGFEEVGRVLAERDLGQIEYSWQQMARQVVAG